MAFPLVSTVLIQILVQIIIWDMAFCFRGKQNSEVPKREPVVSYFLETGPLIVVSYKYDLIFKVSWQKAICPL